MDRPGLWGSAPIRSSEHHAPDEDVRQRGERGQHQSRDKRGGALRLVSMGLETGIPQAHGQANPPVDPGLAFLWRRHVTPFPLERS